MKVILCGMLVLFATNSVGAMTDKERTNIAKVQDSLIIIDGKLHEFRIFFNAVVYERDSRQPKTFKEDASFTIGLDITNCLNYMTLIRHSLNSYLEGSRVGACDGLWLSHALYRVHHSHLVGMRSTYDSVLGKFLRAKTDSVITLLDDTWLYIHDNIPDSCSSYVTTSE